MAKRCAFVNYGDSREGTLIADALKEQGYYVYATRAPDPLKLNHTNPDPLSVDQFIDSNIESIVATIKICRAVVYHVLDTPKVACDVFKIIETDPGVRKTIVIVSPIFTWAGTPRTTDWKERWPHPKYPDHLAAERYLTSLSLRLYVMDVGLLYGDGESALLPLFKAAWHANGHFVKRGPNVIPVLHVRDMAQGAVALLSSPPEQPVIVAHDGSNPTRTQLVKAINEGFSNKPTELYTDEEAESVYGRELMDWLTLDLELDASEFQNLDFERHAGEGFVEFIETVVDEFVKSKLLSPLRILTFGLSDTLTQQIVDYYGVVHATRERVMELFAVDKSEEALAIKEQEKEERERQRERENEGEEGEGNEEEEKTEDRYPEILRIVLNDAPSIRFQGYLLDYMPEDEEDRDALLMEDGDLAPYFPKYILTSNETFTTERYFIAKGSHCMRVEELGDVQRFLGLPRNFSRTDRLLEARRRKEQIESEQRNQELKRRKREREREAERLEQLKARDQKILQEVNKQLEERKQYEDLPAREFLMTYVVPMFMKPLSQINEARPDDPLRSLVSHFEKEARAAQSSL